MKWIRNVNEATTTAQIKLNYEYTECFWWELIEMLSYFDIFFHSWYDLSLFCKGLHTISLEAPNILYNILYLVSIFQTMKDVFSSLVVEVLGHSWFVDLMWRVYHFIGHIPDFLQYYWQTFACTFYCKTFIKKKQKLCFMFYCKTFKMIIQET